LQRDTLERAARGDRITSDEALELFEHASLTELGLAAGAACQRLHPEPVRTYVIDRNINYTNICISGCRFCAFFRPPGHPEGYLLSTESILEKVREAVGLGATQILMQGGLHPDLQVGFYEELLRAIKTSFSVHVHSFSAPEIAHIARVSGLDVKSTLVRLRDAGLDSLPGGGAEILVDRVRGEVSPVKCSASEWIGVMEATSGIGMRATATRVFGHVENHRERIEHLMAIRRLQGRTRVFTAFIPWTYQPVLRQAQDGTALGGEAAGGHDYLRTLAISRLVLDNVPNIQASWVTQGDAIAQVALRFGANDMGSTMMEENVVAAAGIRFTLSEERLVELIHDAGFDAAQRDTMYETVRMRRRAAGSRQ
jgi:cyclic dehypoxanthinyl futalosine synthase